MHEKKIQWGVNFNVLKIVGTLQTKLAKDYLDAKDGLQREGAVANHGC